MGTEENVINVIIPEVIQTPLSSSTIDHQEWESLLEQIGTSVREDGHLIAFPTETVYGLGANALNRNAVLRIFEAKQRPLNDPVICHVSCYEDALPLFDCDAIEIAMIHLLAKRFWPGPLSIVARASSTVPAEVTAQTGFVSVRCPKNHITLELIRASKVPIAAPSANRFGHISPSCSSHVMKNFETIRLKNFPSQKRLLVLEGGSCQIGIESTVCKIEHRIGPSGDNPQLEVTVLRRGFVTKEKIRETIEEGVKVGIKGLSPKELEIIGKVKIEISSKILYESNVIKSCSQCKMTLDSPIAISNSSTQTSVCSVPCERCFNYDHSDSLIMYSPGMNLTHYSPSIPTYLCPLLPKSMISTSVVELPDGKQVQLNQSIIIDAFNQLQHCQSHVLRYFSLCESSDITLPSSIEEMISNVFHQLHNAEDFGIDFNASVILIYDFKSTAELIGEVGLAAYDRLYRSASGQRVKI